VKGGVNMKGNMGKMMKQMQQMQRKMVKAQEELAAMELEATDGGGVGTAKADGMKKSTSVDIQEDVVDPDDVEMLEDLVLAAVNDVMKQVDDKTEATMGKFTKGMNLPGMF